MQLRSCRGNPDIDRSVRNTGHHSLAMSLPVKGQFTAPSYFFITQISEQIVPAQLLYWGNICIVFSFKQINEGMIFC